MRRVLPLVLAVCALAAVAALAFTGCGSSKSAKSPLDDALGYLPKDPFLVVAIKTNVDDEQYKRINSMIDRFPFSGQLKQGFKNGLNRGDGQRYDFDKDIKPALGNDIVFAIPNEAVANAGDRNFVLVWKINGGDAKKLLGPSDRKIGESDGADIYSDSNTDTFDAVDGSVLVSAPTRATLEAALDQRDSGDRLTVSDFERNLDGLNADALVRAEGDIEKILASDEDSAKARKVPWVNALRTFAATTAADPDGVSIDFKVNTEGSLGPEQLPLAAGTTAPPVVKRPGEFAIALRDPAQLVKFVEDASLATDDESKADKGKVEKALGVDIDRDLIGQLGGNSASSIAFDGGYAVRADLKDTPAFRKTLATVMRNLPAAQRATGDDDQPTTVRPAPDGFYALDDGTGSTQYVGIVGDRVVLADDVNRAKEFGAQPASALAEAQGALALSADPKSIVDSIIRKKATGATAILGTTVTGPLKDLTGWVYSEQSGLRGHFKLTVR
ncbi:MAG TPA: DUF3352 domain-containing protein [Thermoleophilaceae bacterium]|jgi:hypothetical protein